MAKCLKCNAEIPDGQKYCDECVEKENKESYLDSLLSSVEPDEIERQRNRFAKRKAEVNQAVAESAKTEEPDSISMPEEVLPEEVPSENVSSEDMLAFDEGLDEFDRAFTRDVNAFSNMSLEDAGKYDILKIQENSDAEFDRMFQEDMDSMATERSMSGANMDEPVAVAEEISDAMLEQEPPVPSEDDFLPSEAMPQIEEILSEPLPLVEDSMLTEEINLPDEFALTEESLDVMELLQEESVAMDIPIAAEEIPKDSVTEMEEGNGESEDLSEVDGMDTDILDLINSMNASEGEEASGMQSEETDFFALEEGYEAESTEGTGQPEDIAGIFADTLRSVDALSEEEQKLLMDIPELKEEEPEQGKKAKKKKKKDRGPGLLKRIFGNIKSERSEEEIAQMKEKILADAEAKERAEEEKKQKAAQEKEEKKKKAAEDKAAALQKKQEKAKRKAEKKAEAARIKKDEKERKKQEIQELIDEIDHDEGRINRIGASIIFIIFAAMALGVLIGTRVYAYTVNMSNAQEDFGNQRYEDAYENVYGLDIKDEDEDFYLQVMTVMYTYKQLNSYQNYCAMGQYPQALDSLLKGLQRYDKYAALASVIGIEDDMDFVRDEIVEQLDEVFDLSEREAVRLAAIEDQMEYTEKVYEIATQIVGVKE